MVQRSSGDPLELTWTSTDEAIGVGIECDPDGTLEVTIMEDPNEEDGPALLVANDMESLNELITMLTEARDNAAAYQRGDDVEVEEEETEAAEAEEPN